MSVGSLQDSACHWSSVSWLKWPKEILLGAAESAQNDTSGTGGGTVPGTVPGVVRNVTRTGVWVTISWLIAGPNASGAATTIVGLNPTGTARLVWKVIWKPTYTATRSATSAAIPKSVPNAVRGVIR